MRARDVLRSSRAIAERLAAAGVLRHPLGRPVDRATVYRWFVGLSPDDPVWDPTTFTKNRERLQNGEVFTKFMTRLLNHSQVKPLLSDEHFSVDGTLIEAWASQKSFRPRMATATMMTAPTSTARSARMTLMRAPATRTAGFIARQPDGGQALLYGPRHHGEPAWACGGRQDHACQWHRRTPGFGDHAEGETQSRSPPHHGR